MARANGKIVPLNELALIFGISAKVVRDYVASGCPIHLKGGPGRNHLFNTADVINWVRERDREGRRATQTPDAAALAEGRKRVALAQAQKIETENAVRCGQLFPIAELERFFGEVLTKFRSALLTRVGLLDPRLMQPTQEALSGVARDFAEYAEKRQIGHAGDGDARTAAAE